MFALVAFGVGVPALAAPNPADQLAAVGERVGILEGDVARIDAEFTQRRGLLGPAEARQRYEDAVYEHVIGQYSDAASAFYALLDADALGDPALRQDSEWYLGESLFQLGNYAVAKEAYNRIVAQGQSHPFFPDAVRRLLEIYGLAHDPTGFAEVYGRYISSGQVAATDQVKYTVAKSFWRQGQAAQAKSLLNELTGGAWFTRAHYLLGTILAEEGDYPASVIEFQKVLTVPAFLAADREVLELTRLALGRVYYEVGDYPQATSWYLSIPPTSAYFADKLYELVWTFIKQEKWDAARDQIGIFLVAFPDHRYAMQLSLYAGHLYMKQDQYAGAQTSYEELVAQYAPIKERLREIENSREQAGEYFTRLAEAQALDMGFDVLPNYAVEMLLADEGVARALALRQELAQEQADLTTAQSVIEEIEAVIMSGSESIGTFSKGRRNLEDIQDESVVLQGRILTAEIAWLQQKGGDALSGEVSSLQERWAQAQQQDIAFQSERADAADAYDVYDAQVREVQGQSFRLHELARNLQAEATATRRFLKENESKLSVQDVQRLRMALDGVETDLMQVTQSLDRIESPATRRRILAPVLPDADPEASSAAGTLRSSYASLQRRVTGLQGRVGGDPSFFQQADQLWNRVSTLESRSKTALGHLSDAETEELEQLKIRLASETAVVARSNSDLGEVRRSADALAVVVTQKGFKSLEKQFSDTVLQADMGIVDVYWLQQTRVSDEIDRVQRERATRESELDARFEIIRQKMQEE